MSINSAQTGISGGIVSDGGLVRQAEASLKASRRDTRIDVFRALALLTIFINHVPGTAYEYLTHKNFGFSDSAEAFVLISGMAVGLAYERKFIIGNRLNILLKVWKRSWTLYCAHILLTCFSLALFCFGGLYMHHAELLGYINIGPVMADPAKAFLGIMTLGHQLGYNNILPLYMVLMLFVPLMLWAAQKNMKLLLVLSGALYLFAGWHSIAPHTYPEAGTWFLNPLSWQFLFVIGICGMVWTRRQGHFPQNPMLLTLSIGYLMFSLLWVRFNWWNLDTTFGVLPYDLAGFNKTFLSLPRLLHILALAYVIAAIPGLNNLARVGLHNPLAILGKYSLPIFICGTMLAMMGQVLKQVNPAGGFGYDTLLIATGIMAQFAFAYYLEWLASLKKKSAADAAAHAARAKPAREESAGLLPEAHAAALLK